MKKIIIMISLCFTILFSSENVFLYIDELKYMNKDELIDEYKEQAELIVLKLKMSEINLNEATIYEKKGLTDSAKKSLENSKFINKEVQLHKRNQLNIKRVLRKDFNIDEKEFEKLVPNLK